ncbi:MAG: hypothetical protein PF630_05860 [Gammaproteobacteria bacterium]|jgi:hypothetical protein|nr:hypothetical protein [Gammaproteobacteria bacterium]
MKTKILIACAAMLASTAVLSAPDFAVTVNSGVYTFDYAPEADSDITALQFDILLPKGTSKESLDISSCVAGLPNTHVGACNISSGILRVLVYSNANSILPAASIGTIKVKSPSNSNSKLRLASAKTDNLKVSNLLYATVDARDVPGDVIQ